MRYLIKSFMKKGSTEKDVAGMLAVLPAQDANDARLIEQGILEGAALVAADRSAAWHVANVENEAELQTTLESYPVYKFCEYEVTPLLATEDNVPQ
jgi:muconolactone delta-isomerase